MRPNRRHLALGVALAISLAQSGCGGGGGSPTKPVVPTTPTPFAGAFLNASESGRITFSIDAAPLARGRDAAQAPIPVTGRATFGGGSGIDLSGTYDAASDTLILAGTGYQFVGRLLPGAPSAEIAGSYIGLNGTGSFDALAGASSATEIHCGTFDSTYLLETGPFNLVLSGSRAIALMLPGGTTRARRLTGTISGTVSPLQIDLAYADTTGLAITASGSLDLVLAHSTGTWSSTQGGSPHDNGTWSGSVCLPEP